MRVQVLISTMHQTDHLLLDKMNIQTDAIVVNQCDRNEIETFKYKGNNILWISCNERGVGLSRNTALARATADILLIADDDVVYEDDYEHKIIKEFQENHKADMIVFNVHCLNDDRNEIEITKSARVRFFSSLKFGAYRFAFRRETYARDRIYFTQLYGGGCIYSAGEDNIFINDFLKKKCYVLASSVNIGQVMHNDSTWFKGYNKKYFCDLGHLMYSIYGRAAYVLLPILLIKNKKNYTDCSLKETLKYSIRGIQEEIAIK